MRDDAILITSGLEWFILIEGRSHQTTDHDSSSKDLVLVLNSQRLIAIVALVLLFHGVLTQV